MDFFYLPSLGSHFINCVLVMREKNLLGTIFFHWSCHKAPNVGKDACEMSARIFAYDVGRRRNSHTGIAMRLDNVKI